MENVVMPGPVRRESPRPLPVRQAVNYGTRPASGRALSIDKHSAKTLGVVVAVYRYCTEKSFEAMGDRIIVQNPCEPKAPWMEPPSAEMLELAGKALAACEKRRGEDIEEWAERIANDVAGAND